MELNESLFGYLIRCLLGYSYCLLDAYDKIYQLILTLNIGPCPDKPDFFSAFALMSCSTNIYQEEMNFDHSSVTETNT